jgi:hypothetical protein
MGLLFIYVFFQTGKSYGIKWAKEEIKEMKLFDA